MGRSREMPQQANAKSDQAVLRLASTIGLDHNWQKSDNSASGGQDENLGMTAMLIKQAEMVLTRILFKPTILRQG